MLPILIKIVVEITAKCNLGTFLAIMAPKNTPIQAKVISAKNDPIHTSKGEEKLDVREIVNS